RVDWLALALSLTGLALFAWCPMRWLAVSLFLVSSLFVKYTFLASPAAVGLSLVLGKQWRLLLRYAGAGILFCAGGFAIAQWCTNGHFAFHEFDTHADTYELRRFWLHLATQVADLPVVFGLAFLSLYPALRRREASPAVVYLPMTLISSCTAGKV